MGSTRRTILTAGAVSAATVRDFVRSCQNPILVLTDEVPARPYGVAMECSMLAPKAEVSMFPWKEPKERIPLAVLQIHSLFRVHWSA
jgi:hypothetical protein